MYATGNYDLAKALGNKLNEYGNSTLFIFVDISGNRSVSDDTIAGNSFQCGSDSNSGRPGRSEAGVCLSETSGGENGVSRLHDRRADAVSPEKRRSCIRFRIFITLTTAGMAAD